MSEREPQLHGAESAKDQSELHAEEQERLREAREKADRAHEKSKEDVEKLAESAKKEALSGKEKSAGEHHKPKTTPNRIDKHAKQQAYRKTLKNVQHKLPKSQRAFSKFIHQPTVEAISEVGGKTIARPSALLSGGFFALLGTSVVLWASRYYGFRYNFFVYVIMLVAGFLLGFVIEYLWRALRKLSKKS